MDSFRLPLFPEASLASSVITTVFVGVWVVCFFNLRLGWAFSGLVVPGYLAPLVLAKPAAAAVVCAEGVVTYLAVWLLSERAGRWGMWCSFFGRDRFFALVLASVAVRLLGDVWLLPRLGEWANARFGLELDYHNNLHSYGLIVVALMANQFWKPGLARGLISVFVPLALTCLIVRFVLIPFTNFSIGNLQYMYEDIAASLLASPKAYIILITTAFLASRMNLHYSWEFNGILIPSLIALQWYEPLKVLMTLIEAAAIYVFASLLLRAPVLRNQSFEGASKLALFFTVGFAWKMAVGFALPAIWPGVRVSDYYGFGYLLATLLALKAHDKGIVVRMASATFQISLVGAAAGCLIGFLLTLAPRPAAEAVTDEYDDEPPAGSLSEAVERERLALYEARPGPPPDPAQRQAFAAGLRELLAYAEGREPERLAQGRAELAAIGYRVEEVEGRYLCLREGAKRRGWGLYVLALGRPEGLAVLLPAPGGEWLVESALAVFTRLRGRALAVGGQSSGAHATWPLGLARRGLYETFAEVAAGRNAVVVRASDEAGNHLSVRSGLPDGLDLPRLRAMLGGLDIHWPQAAPAQHTELALSRASRRTLLLGSLALSPDQPRAVERVTGRLRPWLLASRARIADAGTNLYQPPTRRELLAFAHEVLTPLLRVVARWQAGADRGDLDAVAALAGRFGYRLIWQTDPAGPSDYLILAEPDRLPRRHWGTYVFRPGGAPFIVATPRPIFERNTLEHGVLLFERLRARAWLLHGAHPDANQARDADVLSPRHRLNLFSLVGQVILREAGDEPMLMVQSRAFGARPTGPVADADALLAASDGATTRGGLSPLGQQVLAALEIDRLKVQLADGSAETMGYQASTVPQVGYLAQSRNKELLLVWLSPLARPLYRQQADNRVQESHFRAVGIATVAGDLYERLRQARPGGAAVATELRRAVERYIADQDVVILHEITTRWPRVRFTRLIDESTQQAFLLIEAAGAAPLVARLSGPVEKGAVAAALTAAAVGEYAGSRATWLEVGGGKR